MSLFSFHNLQEAKKLKNSPPKPTREDPMQQLGDNPATPSVFTNIPYPKTQHNIMPASRNGLVTRHFQK